MRRDVGNDDFTMVLVRFGREEGRVGGPCDEGDAKRRRNKVLVGGGR